MDYPGGTINLHAGIGLGGHDDSPRDGSWIYLWLIQHRRGRTCLVKSSSNVEPILGSRCFRGTARFQLVGLWPAGGIRGTMVDGVFRFQIPQPVEVGGRVVQLPTPGRHREVVEVLVVDRTGHGVSVFDGDLVDVPDPPVGPIHTPIGGPPASVTGTVVAVEGRLVIMTDLADSGMAEADLFLCGVHL